jgi:phenylpropionate dioxygenase-like ring-hydroxylating dioxygenase large terminal subunit
MSTPNTSCHETVVHGPHSHKTPRTWPAEGYTRAPYWVYTDPDIYAQEQAKIFRGKSWHYVGLEAEVPDVGSFKTTYIGEQSVVLTRAEDGSLHVVVNRCAHRGNMLCRDAFGKVKKLYCVYHAWNYNLKGDLTHAAFSHGLRGEGGLPKDF